MATGEWARTTKLIEDAIEILEEQNPMTIRQLFYQLVSRGVLENSLKSYSLVSRTMTKAREDGRVDYDYIVDRSRPVYEKNVFEDAAQYAEVVKHGYRKGYWYTQPYHVEVWVEKDATVGTFEGVVKDELGVTIRVGRGFQSTTKMHEIANIFSGIEKPIRIFYLGDHDPSGVAIEKDLLARIAQNMERLGATADLRIERVAIFKEDIARFKLPPLRIKDSDSRSSSFRRKHGVKCVELDALPPEELRDRLRRNIMDYVDTNLWDRAIAVEKVELASIRATAEMWPKFGESNP
jgi:hypothetical protein